MAKIAQEAGFNQYTVNFLNLLVKKDRMPLVEEICESFEEQYCKLTDTQVRPAAIREQGRRQRGQAGRLASTALNRQCLARALAD